MNLRKIISTLLLLILLFAIYIYGLQTPTNNRNWTKPFAVAPELQINSNLISIHNVRDFGFDEKGLVSTNYIDRQLDASQISQVWFLVEPFGDSKIAAHTYFIFDFSDQPPVAVSVEARRTTDKYSAVKGLFNQYELIYLWTTEEDQTIRRVINYKDRVYMYPLQISKEAQQKLLLKLANQTKDSQIKPRFYNTLTSNCTNELAKVANEIKPGIIPFDKALILPAYSDELLYKLKFIPNDKSLDEERSKYYINDKVNKIYLNNNFSGNLRAQLNY